MPSILFRTGLNRFDYSYTLMSNTGEIGQIKSAILLFPPYDVIGITVYVICYGESCLLVDVVVFNISTYFVTIFSLHFLDDSLQQSQGGRCGEHD